MYGHPLILLEFKGILLNLQAESHDFFKTRRHMNYRLIQLLFLVILASCSKPHPGIDALYPWTPSGIPEADSIFLCIDSITTADIPFIEKQDKKIGLIERFHTLAQTYPDNLPIKIHNHYLELIDGSMIDDATRKRHFKDYLSEIDSATYPYEYHRFLSLAVEEEEDFVKRSDMAISNISFFTDKNCHVDVGRNLIFAGNLMVDLQDTLKAMKYYEQAQEIYTRLNMKEGVRVSLHNKAILLPKEPRDSILHKLLLDPDLSNDPNSHVLILHSLYVSTDSIMLLQEAIDIFDSVPIDHNNYPLALALLGEYHVAQGKPDKGLQYITMAIDSAHTYTPTNLRYYMIFNNFMADAYYFLNEKDSCIEALDRARKYADSYYNQKGQARIYASDAAARIRLAEKNVRLEKQREIGVLIILILTLALVVLWLVFRMRRRQAQKKHEEELMQERHERNLQSIRAQSKVMEESDRMIVSIEEKIDEMKTSSKISEESAENLNRILRIHKSNEENRQGFLKVQQELDTRFIENLKRDFPTLSETQIKLASLIAAGLDSRQIGNILNIEHYSVHKSRYRLRTRLGIPKDQTLEDFLRKYNRPI